MILFGAAEFTTSFTGNFLNAISTSATAPSTIVGTAAGLSYILGGLFVLTFRKWGAAFLASSVLGAEILGRFHFVASGLFPMNSTNAGSIIAGTVIALVFALYIGSQWRKFS